MAEDWKIYKLEDLAKRVTVGFVGSMAQEYIEEGIPMLRSQNIKPFSLDFNNLKFISQKFHKKIIKSSLREDDVAIVRTGNPGTACVIPRGLAELNCSDLVIVTPDKNKLDPHFLCFYFNSIAGHYVSAQLVGAVQQHFNVGAAKLMKIKLPSIHEQKEIVDILKSIQDKIELNLQMNKTLEEMAMTLYKHWFVDFGPFQEGEFVESELGMIPKGWEVKMFGKVVAKYIDNRGKTPPILENGIPLLEVKHISSNLFPELRVQKYVSIDTYNSWFRAHLELNDIIISTVGTVGLTSLVPQNSTVCIAQNLLGIRFNNNRFPRSFMFYLMKSPYFLNQIENRLVITVQKSIKRKDLDVIPIIIPDLNYLLKYSNTVDNYLDQIESNIIEIQTLTTLRDTLLPKLISGEVRVKEAVNILEEVM